MANNLPAAGGACWGFIGRRQATNEYLAGLMAPCEKKLRDIEQL
jgi:hypothetical protein